MSISRNVVWNTASSILPIAVGILVVPAIIRHLGAERFGVLSGVWVLIGYFSIFDLGLGRTLTKAVADRLGAGAHAQVPAVVSTTLAMVSVSGVLIGISVLMASHPIAQRVAGGSLALTSETARAILWLAISLPFVLVATALNGLLEAYQKFSMLSAVRVPVGALVYLVPLALLPFTTDIGTITAALALLRIVNVLVLLALSLRVLPALRGRLFVFHRDLARPLLVFGGWLTVSNIIGPVMVYFDRFMIAGILGSAAIAFYTVPYDVVTRLWVLPAAIQGVLFPTLILLRAQDFPRLRQVFARSSQTTMLLLAPALIVFVLFAHEGLKLWVGPEFAMKSSWVAKVLAYGVMVNAMARTPFVFVQSEGRANWAAITHALELPAYVLSLWWAIRIDGIEGAAFAWTTRMAVDTIVFYGLAVKLEGRLRSVATRDLLLLVGLCAFVAGIDWIVGSLLVRGALVLLVGGGCLLALLGHLKGAWAVPANSLPVVRDAP